MTGAAIGARGDDLSALRRVLDRPVRDGTELRCQLCNDAVAQMHRHLIDEQTEGLLCACQPCTILFHRAAAGGNHYRLIPDRRVRLAPFPTKALGVPVGLAYFVVQGDGGVVAHYPSPLGTTTYEVEPDLWTEVVAAEPELGGLVPRVEAALINTARGACEHWIVPIDDCYRLVAVIRENWRGLSGGGAVWPAVDDFFRELAQRKPVR
jgi:hypothetical protein